MLLIDRREEGSDLVAKVRRLGCDAEYVHLDAGDCCFEGWGEDEAGQAKRQMIGLERKRLSDLVNCMRDRRLSGAQLRRMRECYDFSMVVVEDVWRPGENGEIVTFRGGLWRTFYTGKSPVAYRQVLAYLTTLELVGGVTIRRSSGVDETACQYAALWHWFNGKKWREHNSIDQIYTITPGDSAASRRGRRGMLPVDRKITRLEMMAAQLPGVDSKARDVARYFGTVRAMAEATEKDWQKIKGIGKLTAREAIRVMSEVGI